MAEAALKVKGPIFSLGSIIHNKQVVKSLARKGLKTVKSEADVKSGTCIISSHGISPDTARRIVRRGIKIIDTTCPFVLKAQLIAKSLSGASYNVIIVGDALHPEVKALVDFVATKAFVVKDGRSAGRLKLDKLSKYIVIAQTTQSKSNFVAAVRAISKKRCAGLKVFNTVCKDAEERQAAALLLARTVDAMFVVGGNNSANTKRLYEVSRRALKASYLIETEAGIKKSWLKDKASVGITSGASTPEWIVGRVVRKISAFALNT
jgi:4-hydroxy-3-methylbut-2-enyl diphosphate reductase